MARISEVTDKCFKSLYDFIDMQFSSNEEVRNDLRLNAYKAERNVMLELIKREAIEDALTERVMKYSEEADGLDEFTGLLVDKE
ncbi:hypothetical protein [Dyadobacter sp. OTU695]|uniref:hypothetical protein n=1 Tax=Dyadobacter sp. OTU695 TaxID=3043860 RepID=UPI00313E6867